MKVIAELKEQHTQILKSLTELNTSLQNKPEKIDVKTILALLDSLTLQLKEHFKVEDDIFYPSCINYPDHNIQITADLFWIQLGKLKQQYSLFMKKWNQEAAIQNSKEKFLHDIKALIEDLQIRIKNKDSKLFTLF